MITPQDDINLTDAHFFAKGDIHDLFKRMRADDPVHWTQGKLKRGFWSIFKHEDAYTVYKGASEYFSNGKFSVGLPSSPEIEAAFSPQITGCNRMLVASDGELHRDFRKAFNAMFLPRAIKQYEASDLVNQGMGAEDPEYQVEGSAVETRNQAWGQAVAYCTRLALERRGSSGTDLLSVIANSRVLGGRELSAEEIGYNGFMFIIGGLDTTRNSIAGGLLELIRNRDQMRRLREDKSLMRPAVEEILRWTSAITHSMRTALKDTEIRGRKIKEGDWVVVWNASANRDEEAFANADHFDIARDPNDHFAFAYGEHFCLGAHLARLEIRLIFEEILDRMPDVELDGEVEWLASNLLHGVKRMPIKFTPRRAAAA